MLAERFIATIFSSMEYTLNKINILREEYQIVCMTPTIIPCPRNVVSQELQSVPLVEYKKGQCICQVMGSGHLGSQST